MRVTFSITSAVHFKAGIHHDEYLLLFFIVIYPLIKALYHNFRTGKNLSTVILRLNHKNLSTL